jgi:hypothetical protein
MEEGVVKRQGRERWRIPTNRANTSNQLNFEAGISVYQRTANNSVHRNFETPNIDYRNAPQTGRITTLKSFPKRANSIGQKGMQRDPSSDSGSKELTVYNVLREERKKKK